MTSRLHVWHLAASFSILSWPALAVQPFQGQFVANYLGMQASATMTIAASQNHEYDYTLTVRNQLANLTQQTHFDEVQGQLRPLTSHDTSALLIKKRDVRTRYDWQSQQATWTGDIKTNRRGPIALQPGDMDGLLINLALARDALAGKPLNYRMVDDGRIKSLSYAVADHEDVRINGKLEHATKLVHQDNKKELFAWVVADQPVPVRLLQRENGKDVLELRLQSLELNASPQDHQTTSPHSDHHRTHSTHQLSPAQ